MARQQKSRIGNKAKSRQSANHEVKYKKQRFRTEANKLRRFKRHLEKHPNDLQALKSYEIRKCL